MHDVIVMRRNWPRTVQVAKFRSRIAVSERSAVAMNNRGSSRSRVVIHVTTTRSWIDAQDWLPAEQTMVGDKEMVTAAPPKRVRTRGFSKRNHDGGV